MPPKATEPSAEEKAEKRPQKKSGMFGFFVRIIRLVVFGSAIIYTGISIIPASVLPSLTGYQITLIAIGSAMVIGIIVFLIGTPGRSESIIAGSFDLEAMAAVVIGILTILALSIVSIFTSQKAPADNLLWLLLVGIFTFYVFMIIRRGLALQTENEELKQKYGELLELDEEKTDFVTVTSHQLRTPLNEIKWILDYVIGQDMSDSARSALQKGLVATNRMVSIVNSILRARTLDLHGETLVQKEINIGEIIEKIVEDEKEFAREKGVTLTFYPPESAIIVLGEDELGMAIENVMDNAIRYSPNASVTISLQKARSVVQIRIEDTGVGIAPEDRERVFRKFYRGQNALLVQPDGTGIGLYTTKKIIERHGGSINFTSELKKGTTFLIALPLAQS